MRLESKVANELESEGAHLEHFNIIVKEQAHSKRIRNSDNYKGVERKALVHSYLRQHVRTHNNPERNTGGFVYPYSDKYIEDWDKTDNIIDWCLNHNPALMEKDSQGHVWLTPKGVKFSDFIGLVTHIGKDISELLSSWRNVILTLIGASALFNIDWILSKALSVACTILPKISACMNL